MCWQAWLHKKSQDWCRVQGFQFTWRLCQLMSLKKLFPFFSSHLVEWKTCTISVRSRQDVTLQISDLLLKKAQWNKVRVPPRKLRANPSTHTSWKSSSCGTLQNARWLEVYWNVASCFTGSVLVVSLVRTLMQSHHLLLSHPTLPFFLLSSRFLPVFLSTKWVWRQSAQSVTPSTPSSCSSFSPPPRHNGAKSFIIKLQAVLLGNQSLKAVKWICTT